MPPRPQRKVAHKNTKNNNDNKPASFGVDDSVLRLNINPSIVPHTSTLARPPVRRERKPITHTNPTSPSPPSLPPFLPSPHRDIIEPTPAASPVPDDPFGFFAAERRLKRRAQLQNRTKIAEKSEIGMVNIGTAVSEDAEQLPISDGRPAFATPPTDSDDVELELNLRTFVSGTRTPPGHTPVPLAASPRHHRPKRKVIPSSEGEDDEGGEPLLIPQTPSPTKRVSTVTGMGPGSMRRPFADISHFDNSPVKKSAATAKAKGRKKGASGGGRSSGPARKKYKTDETLAEEQLKGMTEELEQLLPSRPKRDAALRKSGVPPMQKAATTKKATTVEKKGKGKLKRKAKPRSKKATAEEGEEVTKTREGESLVLTGEEREQFEVAREGRREYFKQVDDYVMEEESVYVI